MALSTDVLTWREQGAYVLKRCRVCGGCSFARSASIPSVNDYLYDDTLIAYLQCGSVKFVTGAKAG
jgi:hypothetical protein